MGQKTLNGIVFRQMINDACRMLTANKALIDSLNVFPVPDGDTGTNMSMTMASAVGELNAVKGDELENLSIALSKGALKGARGNSGVILSQILKGICNVLCEFEEVTTKDFSRALKQGAEVAYSAVSKPKEGTILTVIRVIAENSAKSSLLKLDFSEYLGKLVERGEEILAKTPDMLPVLKKAGTVDAGGKGVVELMRGMYYSLSGKALPDTEIPVSDATADASELTMPDYDNLDEIKYGYCTEFFVVNINKTTTLADIDKLRDRLMEIGDSVICIGDLELIKVHVHTNTPGNALQYAMRLGECDKIKIENMRAQNRALVESHKAEHKEIAMISVCNGDGIKSMFNDLGVSLIIDGGQTMNPSVDNILSVIKRANADSVIVFPNNKNIILAAEQAKELAECEVLIVPTLNVQQGLRAAMNFSPTMSAKENFDSMLSVFGSVICGQLTYAIKSTTIDDITVKDGDLIGLDNKKILVKGNDITATMLDLLDVLGAADHDVISLFYGNNLTEDEANAVVSAIEEKYPDLEIINYYGGQQHYYFLISIE